MIAVFARLKIDFILSWLLFNKIFEKNVDDENPEYFTLSRKKKRLFKFISFVTPKPHKSNETFFLINKTEVSTEIVNKLLEGIKGLQKKKRKPI